MTEQIPTVSYLRSSRITWLICFSMMMANLMIKNIRDYTVALTFYQRYKNIWHATFQNSQKPCTGIFNFKFLFNFVVQWEIFTDLRNMFRFSLLHSSYMSIKPYNAFDVSFRHFSLCAETDLGRVYRLTVYWCLWDFLEHQ